ncbi:MAG: O-antigen ligase family protein [Ignavibacteriaceae bacterium]
MTKKQPNYGISILFGVIFLSPVTYSIVVYEMDVVQRMYFFSLSLLLFLVFIARFRIESVAKLNKPLAISMMIFPFTFFTVFLNGSSNLILLKLTDLIIPLSILLQSAVILLMIGEEKFFKVVSYSVVIVSTLFSIIGVLEVFQIKIIALPTFIPPGSTLGHRSFAAEFLLSSIPFFFIVNDYVKKDKKILLFLAAVINVSFLLFTRNRSGLIILLMVAIIYLIFILLKKKKGVRLKLLAPVFTVIIISFLISLIPVKGSQRPDIESTAGTLFSSEFKSNRLRMNFWDASLQMIRENPLTGIGVYRWSGYYPKYFGDYFTDENVTYVHSVHAHNDFLEIFAESGVLSFIIFVTIYFLIALSLFKKIKWNEKYFPLLLTFLVTSAYSLVAFPNYKFSSFFLASVVAGAALVNLQSEEKKSLNIKFIILKRSLFVLIIIGFITSYIRLNSELNYGESIYLKERRQYAYMEQKLDNTSDLLYPFDASKQPIDYYRGIANYYLRNYKEALNNTLNARNIAPFNPIVLNNVAASYENLGNADSTKAILERMKVLFPNYIKPQSNLITLYYEAGDTSKANLLFEKLINKDPDNTYLLELKNRFKLK